MLQLWIFTEYCLSSTGGDVLVVFLVWSCRISLHCSRLPVITSVLNSFYCTVSANSVNRVRVIRLTRTWSTITSPEYETVWSCLSPLEMTLVFFLLLLAVVSAVASKQDEPCFKVGYFYVEFSSFSSSSCFHWVLQFSPPKICSVDYPQYLELGHSTAC